MPELPTPGIAEAPTTKRADGPSSAGTEWIVDALECDETCLRDLDGIGRLCDRVVMDLGLNVLGQPLKHRFPHPGGVTLLYMLSESHLACHTYPEFRLATFNLYCCRTRAPWDWTKNLADALRSSRIEVRKVDRGLQHRSAGRSRGES